MTDHDAPAANAMRCVSWTPIF